jgi:hypothetical protein
MFAPMQLPAGAIDWGVDVGREGFCEKQLTFAKRTKGNLASGIGAFMKHDRSSLLSEKFLAGERLNEECTRKTIAAASRFEFICPVIAGN